MVAALVVCLVGSSLLDVAVGQHRRVGEVQHVLDFVGLAVVWLLSRPVARAGAARVTASPSSPAACSSSARSSLALVALLAAPASAHASLLSTDPSNGGVYDTPPKAITLRFSEGVEVSLGGIRAYTSDRQRVVTGKPEHPNGQQSVVTTSLPKIGNGTYVVTWRVISADSHPIEGAYTFQVGSKATLSDKNAKNAAASLLSTTGGSRTVGVVYGIDRGFLYAGIALLIGGAVFLAGVWPAGRDDRRARWLVWSGWITVFVTTAFGIALEGVYGAGLPLSDVFDTTVLRDELDTRYGHIALIRLALLVLAIPLLRVLLHRRPAAEHPLRWWWKLSALVVGAGIAVTPGIAGHASTGIQTGLAIPADLVHVAGMACWLGGLVLLCRRGPAPTQRRRAAQGPAALLRARAGRDRGVGRVGRVPGVAAGRQHRRAQDHRLRAPAHRQVGGVRGADRGRRVQPRGREPPLPRAPARRRGVRDRRRPGARRRRRTRNDPRDDRRERPGTTGGNAGIGRRAASGTAATTTTTTSGTTTSRTRKR